jgi:hypothetical protein
MAVHVAHRRRMTNAYKILVGYSEKKKETWNVRHSWENNTQVGMKQIYLGFLDAIHLAQNRR